LANHDFNANGLGPFYLIMYKVYTLTLLGNILIKD